MLKFDLHIHSYYSFDSLSHPEKIAKVAIKKGLNGIAITDHNVFCVDWTALREKYPDLIIIQGSEIGTKGVGDILCYFIESEISSKDPFEVVKQVHEQGGLAVLAHPFHHGRTINSYPAELIEQLDAIETANAHNCVNNKMAEELADRFSKPYTGGSDAHIVSEVGNGYTLLNLNKKDARNEEILKSAILKSYTPECSSASFYSFYFSQMVKYLRKYRLLKQK